jgi:hypothetical protein
MGRSGEVPFEPATRRIPEKRSQQYAAIGRAVAPGRACREQLAEPRDPDVHSFLAYIDPGSGSLIIQAVIATALAVPFFLREQIGRVVRNLRRGKPHDRVS